MKAAEGIRVQMYPGEVELLIQASFAADDIERAFTWAQLLLARNDPIDEEGTS